MDWFVLSHSLKLIALKCYHVAFHMSNILQTISIPKAAFLGGRGVRYTWNFVKVSSDITSRSQDIPWSFFLFINFDL